MENFNIDIFFSLMLSAVLCPVQEFLVNLKVTMLSLKTVIILAFTFVKKKKNTSLASLF